MESREELTDTAVFQVPYLEYISVYNAGKWNIQDARNWQTAVNICSDKSFLVRGRRAKLFLLIRFKFFTSSLLSTGYITHAVIQH